MKKLYFHAYTQERWKKQKVENCGEISLLNSRYNLRSNFLNEKLKAQTEKFLLECQNGFRKGRSCNDPLFGIKSTYRNKKRV
jgi:hypothetical protein